ncbi:hypothetical protein ABZ942_26590 [Nocardia sp. NPDC046473]
MAAVIAFFTAFSRSSPRSRSAWNSLRELNIAVNSAFHTPLRPAMDAG